jgi:hypothetical protein
MVAMSFMRGAARAEDVNAEALFSLISTRSPGPLDTFFIVAPHSEAAIIPIVRTGILQNQPIRPRPASKSLRPRLTVTAEVQSVAVGWYGVHRNPAHHGHVHQFPMSGLCGAQAPCAVTD